MASCFCVRLGKDTVKTLDFRHCNLRFVPDEIVEYDETLEELLLDSNDIRELPRDLFHCELLKKLGVSDNELVTVPTAVASLVHLEELDISKNGIVELPDNIKGCKSLRLVEVSVNPLGKLPEGFTQLMNLSHLYLNDTLLDYLPASFGRLARLKVLELRENRLKALPKSISRLTELERLDLGQNSFREIPEVIGCLTKLTEVWIDTNKVTQLPQSFGNLTCLVYFDASCNRLEYLPAEMDKLESLTDLHLSKNFLHQLPENIGQLSSLTTLKADNNQLASLPMSVGGLVSLEELILSANDLEDLPPSIGLLRRLRHLNVDDNMLQSVPAELGSCSAITLLSLRGNYLKVLPDEIGRIAKLTVVNLSNNRLQSLPYSFTKLKNLQALWLSENQSKPLIPLQSEFIDEIGTRVLTCFMFPQQPQDYEEDSYLSDGESFHQSVWEQERAKRSKIIFDVEESEAEHKNTARATTPYPKETIRPRFRMGVLSAHSNGHVQVHGKKSNLKDKVQSPQMELLPSKPSVDMKGVRRVRGRRELELDGIRIREAKVTRPKSPGSAISDSLSLFQADKEKRAKDKARIRRTSNVDSDSEGPSSPKGKGFFKKSKSDRGSHSDTEAIDPEWTPRTGSSHRRALTNDNSGQERRSSIDAIRTPLMEGQRNGDLRKERSTIKQNGSAKHNRQSNDVITDYGFIDRRQGDYVDGRRMEAVGHNERRRSDVRSNENARFDQGDSGVSGNVAFYGKRNSHQRRSGYGTDPELEELYHHSLEKETPRMQTAQYRTPAAKASGYLTDPDRGTPQSGRVIKAKKPDPHPHSGYGTDSEIMAYNGPFDYSSPAEDHGRSSRGAQRTLERQNRTPKRKSEAYDDRKGKWVDGIGYVQEQTPERVGESNEEALQWAYPTFEANKGTGFNEQPNVEKREFTEEPRGGNHARMKRVDHSEELGRRAISNATSERVDHSEELGRRALSNATSERVEHSEELGRRAISNASSEKGDGRDKEVRNPELSTENESNQELHWDISEILGSSSRTTGHLSTPASTPPKAKLEVVGHVEDVGKSAKSDKTFKSSTPDNDKQIEKNGLAVKNGPDSNPALALRLEDSIETVSNHMTNLELRSKSDIHKDGRPLPPYQKKRDPNSPLPPSPHTDTSLRTVTHGASPNMGSKAQYYPAKHRSDSPLPAYSRRTTPIDTTPNTHLRNHQNGLHIVKQATPSSENRNHAKRGAIPTYEEAVLRRKDSLGKQQSHSLNSLTRDISKQLKVYPIPVAASSEDLLANKLKQDIRYTTQPKLSNERLNDEIDDYEVVDDLQQGSRAKDHELQGQPHDRQAHSLTNRQGQAIKTNRQTVDDPLLQPHDRQAHLHIHRQGQNNRTNGKNMDNPLLQPHDSQTHLRTHRQGGDIKTNGQNVDDPSLHGNEVQSKTPTGQTTRQPPPERTNASSQQLPRKDAAGSLQRNQYKQKHVMGNENWALETDMNRNVQRGRSPAPYSVGVRRSETPKRELLQTHSDGRSPGYDQTPVSVRRDGDNTKSTVQQRRLHVLRARMQNEMKSGDESTDDVFQSPLPSRSPGIKTQTHTPPYYHRQPRPQHQMEHQQRDQHRQPHPQHQTELQPSYQHDTYNTKNQSYHHHHYHPAADTHESPAQKPRQDERRGPLPSYQHHRDQSPTTSQQQGTHSAHIINHPTPDTQKPWHDEHQLRAGPTGYQPHWDQSPSTTQQKVKPFSVKPFSQITDNSTPDTQKPWHDEHQVRSGPTGYQHDWSPSAVHQQGKTPSQVMDHVDVAETRRGTPPGSSGSSTIGCNGHSFAPSPSLQRRLPPYQSPLPSKRADPDGMGGPKTIPVVIYKNPGLGFSITGGQNSPGNPFHPDDMGIFVTKVQPHGPADHCLFPGDKILNVNDQDFVDIDHEEAVQILKHSNPVSMVISREA